MDMYGPQQYGGGQPPSLEPQGYSIELIVRGQNDFIVSHSRPEMQAPNMDPSGLGQGFGSSAMQEQFSSLEEALLSIVGIVNRA